MSTQTRNIGGGGSSRNQKKSHIGSGGGSGGGGGGGNSGGGGDSSITHISHKKSDKTEKQEKSHPTPTAEQLRIAQIIETNKFEDPHMREKVATLIEMTQRSEEEVCCALNECDNNLERAVVFLLETLPVGAFEKSSKKKKNKTVNAAQDNLGDGDWTDNTVNVDKREKSRNRSNRNGRGNTDSRGWRGREARENERNSRGVERDDKANDNYRGGQRGGGRSGRGSNYVGRRGGGRVGGGRAVGGRTERADYNSRYNSNDDHQEVELWDNIIAQNAEKQQQHSQDDAWGDWDNEEYVGSLKNSKVFTTSNLPNQTAASVLSSGLTNNGSVGAAGNSATTELAAPPGLEHHLGTSVIGNAVNTAIQSPGSHLNTLLSNAVGTVQKLAEENNNSTSPNVGLQPSANTSLLQYSAAVSNSTSQLHQQQQQLQGVVVGNKSGGSPTNLMVSNTAPYGSGNNAQFSSAVDSFTNAANAAANLVQQVQKQQKQQQKQQQPQLASQLKASATLSAEQSQYFNSLTSQNTAASASAVAAASVQQQQQLSSYGQKQASVPFQASYANVFASAAGAVAPIGNTVNADPIVQLGNSQQSQARRPRAKLPPPSKIPSTAVEMPGDSLNNIGYLDVQFGALDFGTEEAFENIPEKFNNAATLESQQQQQQQTQQQQQLSKSLVPGSVQDVATYDNQNKAGVAAQQQSSLTGGIQSSHLDALAASYTQRTSQQQQHTQQMVNVGSSVGVGVGGNANTTAMQPGSSALDQLTKSDHYSQASNNVAVAPSGYQSSYQNSVNAVTNKVTANVFQPSVAAAAAVAAAQAVYGNTAYGSVQSSGANTYQPQTYGSYQPNSVNSYQHQHTQNHQHQHQQVTGGAQVSSNMTVSSGTVVGGTSVTQNIPSVVGGVGSNSSSNNTANNNVIANASYLSSAYGPQPSTYQTNPGVYGNSGLSNNTGYSVNTSNSTSQYTSFNTSSKVKENVTNAAATVNTSHYDSVTGGASVNSNTSVSVASSANSGGTNSNNQNSSNITVQNTSTNLGNINTSAANVASGSGGSSGNIGSGVTSSGSSQSNSNNTSNISNNVTAGNSTITNTTGGNMGNSASTVGSTGASAVSVMAAAVTAVTTASSSTSINKTSGSGGGSGSSNTTTGNSGVGGVAGVTAAAAAAAAAAGASGIAPNIQMVSQYIQTSLPYYQQPVYSYEDLQMMQQRVPHVPGYYDLNYTPTSLGAGRDNLGSVAYSTMTDGRFARTDNNSSPVSNVSSTLSQQAGSSGPMLNVPYAYFYGGNVMPGSFQYGTPAIYPQIQAANTASGGQFPKPSYSTGYGSTNYDGLTQATPDYGKGTYPASVNQQSKSQNVVNPPQVATSSDITSSMYGKGHVALNKVNSYEKQSFHSATPPPFNMPNTQTAGGTSGQPYGMYLPTMPAGGHHMIHPPMHQMDGRLHNSSRRDSNSAGQRQTTNSQTKSTTKQVYSPSYWTGQN